MPPAPDGYSATLHDMQMAREAVEAFISAGEAYIACLEKDPDDRVLATIRNQMDLQMDLAVARYNMALCAYSGGEDCAQAQSAAGANSTSSYLEQASLTPQAVVGDLTEDSHNVDPSAQADTVGPSIGSEVFGGMDFVSSEGGVTYQTSRQEPAFPLSEPTLPDGTSCGSITQTRNATTGEGLSLRAHYAWEIYNACFEPISLRWTFSGDGLLNSKRTIPARGFQIISCSTKPGTVSGRDCIGGIEFSFEWP
jgi:hypothetical protein